MSSVPWREMTDEQKQRHLEQTRKWRAANRANKKEQENATRRTYYQQNKERILERERDWRDTREGQRKKEAETSKKRYRRLKQEAVTLLGGVCVRCGWDDTRCLEIDHIIPVRGDRSVYGIKLYRDIVNGGSVKNLQVLCANCHAIKTYEDGNG